jgi:hypothetical protein
LFFRIEKKKKIKLGIQNPILGLQFAFVAIIADFYILGLFMAENMI